MSLPSENTNPIVLRFDDIGASSKRYEIYSSFRRTLGPLGTPGDWLFLKYLPGLRAWGPYRELRAPTWRKIFELLERYDARITLGVTATWVEREDRLVPYQTCIALRAIDHHQGRLQVRLLRLQSQ